MKKLNAILFALACLILISSCKKDDEPKISKTELLAGKTSKSWKQTVAKENGVDEFNSWPACDKDDLTVFSANKNFEFNEGASKCDPEDDYVIESSTWEFKSNETVLKASNLEAKILELTATTLRLEYTNNGNKYEETYIAQ